MLHNYKYCARKRLQQVCVSQIGPFSGCHPATPPSSYDSCEISDDCSANEVCEDYVCRAIEPVGACDRDIMCPISEVCVNGVCTSQTCSVDSDCEDGAACKANQCRQECAAGKRVYVCCLAYLVSLCGRMFVRTPLN